jgi:cytochrome c
MGRVAGSVVGFEYSDAMRDSDIVWNAATLDRFLESPMTYIPGTRMGIRGIKDADRRSDLIAYLQEISDSPDVCEATPSFQ